jgi:hypothetical protein
VAHQLQVSMDDVWGSRGSTDSYWFRSCPEWNPKGKHLEDHIPSENQMVSSSANRSLVSRSAILMFPHFALFYICRCGFCIMAFVSTFG